MTTLATIEQKTTEYAALRWVALEYAAKVQADVEAVMQAHQAKLARKVKAMTEAHEALFELVKHNPDLFPKGAKSIVVRGIKVGYQKGKAKLEIADEELAIEALLALRKEAHNPAVKQRLDAAIKTTHKLVDAGVKKLAPSELTWIDAKLLPAADSVLVMPQDTDTTKAVDALIKATQAELADAA